MSETELNAMQQAVLEALGKEPDWVPIPREVIEGIRTQLHDGLADIAPRLTPENALWVSKHKLTTVHGCEANHLAGLTGFEWTLGNVKGTVLHKAVELGLNWRGVIVPADVVDEALAQLEKDAAVSDAAVARMNQATPVSSYEQARSQLSEIKDPKIRAAAEKAFAGVDRQTERLTTEAAKVGLQVTPTGTLAPIQQQPQQQQQQQQLTNEQYLAQQEARLAAEAALQNRKSAYDLLLEQFSIYGLGSLVEGIKGLVQENVSPSEFAIRLRQTDAYKKRFAANAQRIAGGLRALSEGENKGARQGHAPLDVLHGGQGIQFLDTGSAR